MFTGTHQFRSRDMQQLSEQLTTLAQRAKTTEDTVDVARERNRSRLDARQQKVHASLAAAADSAKRDATDARAKADSFWETTRKATDQRLDATRRHSEERRADHDVKKATHHGEVAVQDACDAVDLAPYVLDQADSAIIDAVIARADADDLATSV
jgi:hypothetical protein